jgi:hypothetical protein
MSAPAAMNRERLVARLAAVLKDIASSASRQDAAGDIANAVTLRPGQEPAAGSEPTANGGAR